MLSIVATPKAKKMWRKVSVKDIISYMVELVPTYQRSQIHFVLFLISPVADILSHFLFYDIQQIKQAAVATTRRFSDCHTYKRNK